MKISGIFICVAMLCLVRTIPLSAHEEDSDGAVIAEMSQAAQNFLKSLPTESRDKAAFEMTDDERLNWHFVPKERQGIPFNEMTPQQKLLAHALLSTALSSRGAYKADTIMSLDQILREMESSGPRRDPEGYHITVFGEPDAQKTWGWRLEGHHISLNFTVHDGHLISATPSFFGANPAEVRQGPLSGLRVLGAEEDYGFELLALLDAEQKKTAILDTAAPSDILTGAQREAQPLEPFGLPASQMNDAQKQKLHQLVREYVFRLRPEFAREDYRKIQEAGEAKIYFAWAGSEKPGEGHYYRIQGPTFLFELDNTQNNANHVHTVWRDFDGDFGRDVLAEHYRTGTHHQP